MKHSDERMLTTHAGSLPRTQALSDLLVAREQGRAEGLAVAEEGRAVPATGVPEGSTVSARQRDAVMREAEDVLARVDAQMKAARDLV